LGNRIQRIRVELTVSAPELIKKLSSIILDERNPFWILKLPKNTYCNIHTDGIRPSALNVLLNERSNSVTFFKNTEFKSSQCNITELQYEKDCMYLFNTQNEHGVLNHDEDRYMLSIECNRSYHDALQFIQENNF
jgi:hypothetical protein